MAAEKNMQCAFDAMRTVTMLLEQQGDQPNIQTCLRLLHGAMAGLPPAKRREDDVLTYTTAPTPLSISQDALHALMRSDQGLVRIIEQSFSHGVAMARADEVAQEARHIRLVACMRQQQHQAYAHEEHDQHEEESLHPHG